MSVMRGDLEYGMFLPLSHLGQPLFLLQFFLIHPVKAGPVGWDEGKVSEALTVLGLYKYSVGSCLY